MARIDIRQKVVQAKLVYYGPGLCGKTTNLEYIAKKISGGQELMSLATEGDRTIFFDFLPLELGKFRGMDVQFKMYTVPGQVRYNETRKMVLKNVDGIVFVADSQEMMMDSNLESLDNLYSNLRELGIDERKVAITLQYNKRDLPGAAAVDVLDRALNKRGYPTFLASARTGEGVFETVKGACVQVLSTLMAQSEGREVAAVPHEPPAPPPPAAPQVEAVPARKNEPIAAPVVEVKPPLVRPPMAQSPAPPVPERPEAPRPPDVESSIRSLLAEATTVLGTLKQHFEQLRAAGSSKAVPAADPLPALKELAQLVSSKEDVVSLRQAVEPLATKGDLAALARSFEDLAMTLRGSIRAGNQPPGEPAHLAATKEELRAMRDAVAVSDKKAAEASASHKADLEALALLVGELPKNVEELLAKRVGDVRELRAELTAMRSAEDATTRAEVVKLGQRLAEVPSKSDLDQLRGSVSALAAAMTTLQSTVNRLANAERVGPREPPEPSVTQAQAPPIEAPSSVQPPPVGGPAGAVPAVEAAAALESPALEPPRTETPPTETPPVETPPVEAPPAEVRHIEVAQAATSETEASPVDVPAQQPAVFVPAAPPAEAPEETPPEVAQGAAPEEPTAPVAAQTSVVEADAPAAAVNLSDPGHVNAARVARVMVSDLYLYHRDAVEEGIRQNDFFERNKDALADMRSTYESRVPEDIRQQNDHLEQAIRQFIAKKRTQLGLG